MTLFGNTGVLEDVKEEFDMEDEWMGGLIQTAFIVCYMIAAPVFGYLGDRYSRKWILVFGLSMWSLSTLFGSFARNFWLFMFFRALVGIGEASYSTIGR